MTDENYIGFQSIPTGGTFCNDLETALSKVVKECKTPDYTAVIYINTSQTLKKKWSFTCSLHLIGQERIPQLDDNGKPTASPLGRPCIYTSSSINTNGRSDTLLGISGTEEKRVEFIVDNLDFKPIGWTESDSSSSQLVQYGVSPRTIYFFNVTWAKKVWFTNVVSDLRNGFASNLELRLCDDVVIKDCVFRNYNGLTLGNREGCIIQLRGDSDNLLITRCTFEKYGNDEILAIFWENRAYNGFAVPEAMKNVAKHKNICICDNIINYIRPDDAPNRGDKYEDDVNDVLITFHAATPNNYIVKPQTFWDNVLFTRNKITLTHHAIRVIKIAGFAMSPEMHNFRIVSNYIFREYTFEQDSNKGYAIDFDLSCWDVPEWPSQCVEIAYNNVVATESLGTHVNAHTVCYMRGANAWIHHNTFNGIDFYSKRATPYNSNFNIVKMRVYDGMLNFEYNDIRNMGYLLHIENGKDDKGNLICSQQHLQIRLHRNYAMGYACIYMKDIHEANLEMTNNVLVLDYNILFLVGYAKYGSIYASGNVWKAMNTAPQPTSSGALYYEIVGCTPNLEYVVFVNNVFTGPRSVTSTVLPSSTFGRLNAICDNKMGELG